VNLVLSGPVIASQLIGNTPLGHTVDVLLGGGLCYFQPNTTEFPKNCRPDQRNLMVEAREKGYNAFSTRADFDALKEGNEASLPFLGLFTPGHMS
jgi:alkaline phosphatase